MLKNIEIVEYKCFKDFKLDGLSQINIISGGNNVGKTALLEVLFIENYFCYKHSYEEIINPKNTLVPLKIIFNNRDVSNNKFSNFLKDMNISLKSNNHDIKIIHKYTPLLNDDEKKKMKAFNQDYFEFLVSKINKNLELYPIEKIKLENKSHNYINSSKPTNKQLIELYSKIQTKGIQHKFLEYLKILDKNIAWLEPQLLDDELFLRVNLNNPEISLVSSELGEGTNRYIEILATLLSNSNGSVFIDEIENGIHHSKLKEICKAIIEIVQKENIQLFITTHDEETIEAFAQASEELNYKDISSIELYKDENNTIQSIVRNSEQFIATVDAGMEVR